MEDRLFHVFAGEHVVILIKKRAGALSYEGYLLDACEKFLYIGSEKKEVFAAIDRSEILSVQYGHPSEFGEMPIDTEVQ